MNSDNLGKIISFFRKQRNFSQQLLSENICSREQLIRIEKGKFYPSIFTISLLSAKLGVDLTKYFEYLNYENPIDVYNFFETFQQLHHLRKYDELNQQISNFKLKYNLNKYHIQQITWYECMVDAHINKRFKENYKILEDLLFSSNLFEGNLFDLLKGFLKPLDYKIINTLSVFQFLIGNTSYGIEILEKATNNLLNKYKLIDVNTLIPLVYNLAKAHYNQQDYSNCIIQCDCGINVLLEQHSFVLLGDLYVMKANSYEALGNKDAAARFYTYYIYYYEMLGLVTEISDDKEKLKHDYQQLFVV